jgi:hypothetical protein
MGQDRRSMVNDDFCPHSGHFSSFARSGARGRRHALAQPQRLVPLGEQLAA